MPDPGISGLADAWFLLLVLALGVLALINWIRPKFKRKPDPPPTHVEPESPLQTERATPRPPLVVKHANLRDDIASAPVSKGTPVSSGSELESPPAIPMVRTRTTDASGPFWDPWEHGERPWTAAEDAELVRLYESGTQSIRDNPVIVIAVQMRIDQLEVARRLIRLTLEPRGDIDDVSHAPNHGKRYSGNEREKLLDLHREGATLPVVAARAGRTQMAAGRQIIERLHPSVRASARSRVQHGLIALSDDDVVRQSSQL